MFIYIHIHIYSPPMNVVFGLRDLTPTSLIWALDFVEGGPERGPGSERFQHEINSTADISGFLDCLGLRFLDF